MNDHPRRGVGRRSEKQNGNGSQSVCSFEGIITILVIVSFDGPVAQLVRAPPCHGGGHGFESRLGRFMR